MPKSARMGTKAKPSAAYRRRLCCFEQRSLGCARFLAKRRSWSFRAGQTKRAIVFVVIHFAGSNRLSYSRLSYVLQPISALDVTSTGRTSVCRILHCVSRHSRRHCRTCHALGVSISRMTPRGFIGAAIALGIKIYFVSGALPFAVWGARGFKTANARSLFIPWAILILLAFVMIISGAAVAIIGWLVR